MGALDPAKILVVLVIALIVLGPERLPRVARQMGGIWRELNRVRDQVANELRDALPTDLPSRADLPRIPSPTPGAVSGFVSGLFATDQSQASTISSSTGEPTNGETVSSESGTASASRVVTNFDNENGRPSDDRSLVVIHPELGSFAFVPDDPGMN